MQRIVAVTTPAANTLLTTLSNVKAELGLTVSTYDALLTRYISVATSKIASFLNRTLARQTYTEIIRKTDNRRFLNLMLSHAPIVSVTSVTEDSVVLAGTDYEIDNEPGLLRRLSSTDTLSAWCADKTIVVYVAGYYVPSDGGSNNLPEAIQEACINLVVNAFRSRGRDLAIRSQAVEGVGSVSYLDPLGVDAGMPRSIGQSIWPYWRPSF